MEKDLNPKQIPPLGVLINKSLSRFQERFSHFFPIVLIEMLIGIPFTLISMFSSNFDKNPETIKFVNNLLGMGVLSWITIGLIFVGIVLALVYFQFWAGLAGLLAIVGEKEASITDYFRKAKPLLWKFVLLSIKSSLLIIGLLPFGFVTLFILFLPWMIWPTFSNLVFLDEPEGNLNPLWKSKKLTEGRFWKLFLYSLLPFLVTLIAGIWWGQNVKGVVSYLWTPFLQITYTPFVWLFYREIYQSIKIEGELDKSYGSGWKNLSIIGYCLTSLILLLIFVFSLFT